MPRTLTVRWDDFEAAFIIGAPDSRYFLNLDTGEVEYTSHLDDEKVRSRIERRTAGEHWLEIPRASTPEGMAEIRDFIQCEEDPDLRHSLEASLSERNPLMGFNRALGTDIAARKRWSARRMAGIHERLLAFCQAHDLVIDDDAFRALLS